MEKTRKTQSRKQPAGQQKHNRQISVKLNDDLYQRLRAACEIQEHTAGQLGRILIEWSLPFYERARSVEALKYLATKFFTSVLKDTPLEQADVNLSLKPTWHEADLVEQK